MEYYSQGYCKNCEFWRPVHRRGLGRPPFLLVWLSFGLAHIIWSRLAANEIKDWRCGICEAMVELDGDESPPESRHPYSRANWN